MTTPKEALETAIVLVADCIPDDLIGKPEYLQQIKAAIPVAELHEQIVRVIQKNPSVFIKLFYGEGIINRSQKELALLLTQLKELECTHPK